MARASHEGRRFKDYTFYINLGGSRSYEEISQIDLSIIIEKCCSKEKKKRAQ